MASTLELPAKIGSGMTGGAQKLPTSELLVRAAPPPPTADELRRRQAKIGKTRRPFSATPTRQGESQLAEVIVSEAAETECEELAAE